MNRWPLHWQMVIHVVTQNLTLVWLRAKLQVVYVYKVKLKTKLLEEPVM